MKSIRVHIVEEGQFSWRIHIFNMNVYYFLECTSKMCAIFVYNVYIHYTNIAMDRNKEKMSLYVFICLPETRQETKQTLFFLPIQPTRSKKARNRKQRATFHYFSLFSPPLWFSLLNFSTFFSFVTITVEEISSSSSFSEMKETEKERPNRTGQSPFLFEQCQT